MNPEKYIILILLVLIIAAFFRIWKLSKILKEWTAGTENWYSLNRTRLEIAGKTIEVKYNLLHTKRDLNRTERNNIITRHLEINGFGTPTFDKMPWREHLANQGFRNVRIIEP